ncbi:MAG: bifunctional folylpolyglutamate synthase/dihydrofolate synthase [Vicingaceae bacterium]|nr:bifunctional folylpolyglutamate synthase/dihydrofolate synthase [Vicingaceae bacterium]
MNYQETLDYLFKQLPMYQRVGNAAYKTDLQNTIELCEILEHPQNKFKSIHIAGTNGKGSTSHMLASILQEAGYKVGLYTSPHLKDFRERVKINGEMISEEEVINFVNLFKNQFELINLSFFEWTVGLAFDYFAKQGVDIAVIETGLGGRLDSTNVVTPELSIITNIGLDHTQFLGDTLPQIAIEKAGIIKQNIPVVIGETQIETKEVFIEKVKELSVPILFADQQEIELYDCDLKGLYQQKNIATAICSIKVLQKKGWEISNRNIIDGLQNVVNNTGLKGRWQILQKKPTVICDTGHNEAGITYISQQLKQETYNRLHIVFGVVNDKSISSVLKLLPKVAEYYFCEANIPRALNVNELYSQASEIGLKGTVFSSVKEALNQAINNSDEEDLIFVGGSTFVVAEVV